MLGWNHYRTKPAFIAMAKSLTSSTRAALRHQRARLDLLLAPDLRRPDLTKTIVKATADTVKPVPVEPVDDKRDSGRAFPAKVF
ncbi:hypothetical protein [Rhizobium sp. Root482]|uniref:hypothetical protein n=1 Tax=Rhizobium sp. Root482 TaxID=1736543 RepID=UPI0007019B07|nr:hypothetical protein [Rhizobium sp. Root482]KQY11178.1 hypothetical protein ASD31_17420 [Rhizobium sp. Root482]